MISYGQTDIGMVRSINQDSIFFSDKSVGNLPNLYIVADGMGGHKAGDYASAHAVSWFVDYAKECKYANPITIMKTGIAKVNDMLLEMSATHSELSGMGTTFVAAVIVENKMYVANIGDSRLYVIHQGETKQITLDHSLVEELIRTGQLDRRRVRFHPEKNIITRALGTGKEAVPDFFEIALQNGEKVLLCSDGLTNMVEDDEIGTIVMGQRFVDKICEQLIERANYYGGKDNIGVVVVEQALNEV
ncbi:MAG: Stp1/IreP family PP2C-type Ser/Thr phosphatase [Lachnospiraceae bacterium]|nr:Stp1/IreP family PP2C-type Ser/Thr phosphatase [Lachnospiraceae bacterium]HCJ08331.1 Stp1/IreP family PP2C-type Ser/Thr phosphatase [Lachnospiraceae bacterium]